MATRIKIKNIPESCQSILTYGKFSIFVNETVTSKRIDQDFSYSKLILSDLAVCKVAAVRCIAGKNGCDIANADANPIEEDKKYKDGLKPQVKINININIEEDISEEHRRELFLKLDNYYIYRMLNNNRHIEKAKFYGKTPESEHIKVLLQN